jgi:exodeoxyribonuclease V beta subunit
MTATVATHPVFDPIRTPIEPGITLVEASAGTGKTYCITLTVLRMLLERRSDGEYLVGDVGRVLVVTFTNAATDELITRVRTRLREAVEVFSGLQLEPTPDTAALFELRDVHGVESLPRLREALGRLDELSIFTIHGFCKRVLEDSALESATPFRAEFMTDDAELVTRAAQDWWRRTMFGDARLATLAVRQGWTIEAFVKTYTNWRRHPRTRLLPEGEPVADALAHLESRCARAAAAWDDARVSAVLDSVKWYANSPLIGKVTSATVRAAVARVRAGEAVSAIPTLALCTTDWVLHQKKGVQKKGIAAIELEDFFPACNGIADAVTRVQHALRASFVAKVHEGCAREKRSRQLLGFDDLLRRVCEQVEAGGTDGALARAIRGRYDAALIDEFQDTDPFQYPIFSIAFHGCPLYLIGDPKQAIYSFRGADVFAYMRAADTATRRFTLQQNWRSTPPLVGAMNALFGRIPRPFLQREEHIPYVWMEAAKPDRALGDGGAPLQWWFVPPDEGKAVGKGEARERFQRATASEIVRLLARDADGVSCCRPGDVAVLVRAGYEAREVQRKLQQAGVPSVVAGAGDVLESEEMTELARLLTAVAAPTDARALRAALATELWGWSAGRIHDLSGPDGERAWQRLVDGLVEARETWLRHGLMRTVNTFLARERVAERMLRHADGDRRLTNLRHAVELLHEAAVEERLSPDGVLVWLARARDQGVRDPERAELRLETDADAVQIVTIHKSKGLEYPIVFCTSLWDGRAPGDAVLVHEDDGSVVFDHGSSQFEAHTRRANAERLAEDLRLAYVALTRAKHRCYVGWGEIAGRDGPGAAGSALGWLLRPDGALDGDEPHELAAAAVAQLGAASGGWQAVVEQLVGESDGAMSCTVLGAPREAVVRWTPEAHVASDARARSFSAAGRQLESWRIVSYTQLARGQHAGGDGRDVGDPDAVTPALAAPLGIHAFTRGRRAGVALHALFEHLPFDASVDAMRETVTRTLRREGLLEMPDADATRAIDDVCAMVSLVFGTPLPDAGFRLADVPRRATLREWKFHLPLALLTRTTLERAFAAHGGAAARYAPHLKSLESIDVTGFLTGVVDLAFEHDGRWHLADWKSNHLGPDASAYGADDVEREMFANHYTLQYHLYVLALHRYLASRLPDYDYDAHVGDVWYAFLRGIDGTPGRGWYRDRPPRALIEALAAALVQGAMHGSVTGVAS